MKKIFYSLLFITLAFVGSASAQSGNAFTFPILPKDTLTNADTLTKPIHITQGLKDLGIQVVVNKLSGTLAGKVVLYQSLDGVNYTGTDSVTTYGGIPSAIGSAARNTVVTPTGTNIVTFQKTGTPSNYYLVEIITSGTVSAAVKVSYSGRIQSIIQKYQ